jgi:hypothetical protein
MARGARLGAANSGYEARRKLATEQCRIGLKAALIRTILC